MKTNINVNKNKGTTEPVQINFMAFPRQTMG